MRSPGDARLTLIRAESVAIFSRVIKKKATCKKKEGERDGGVWERHSFRKIEIKKKPNRNQIGSLLWPHKESGNSFK